jgi:hypothetical protein
MAKRIKPRSMTARHRRRARAHARREGAVMLVVMLILMLATASAAVSVHTTQSELQAAGEERIALQSRYASEAAMMSTISMIDMLGDSGQWLDVWREWNKLPAPQMYRYAEPEIDPGNRHQAMRTSLGQETRLQTSTEIAPLNGPQSASGGSGGGGGSGGSGGTGGSSGSGVPLDTLGSFGPRQAYGLPPEGYVVDVTDCAIAPAGHTPGAPVGGGTGSLKVVQFYCVLTARAHIQLPGAAAVRNWTFGAFTYAQDPYTSEHDSRATILTPQMIVPAE